MKLNQTNSRDLLHLLSCLDACVFSHNRNAVWGDHYKHVLIISVCFAPVDQLETTAGDISTQLLELALAC